MTDRRIGFRLRKLFGRKEDSQHTPEPDREPEQIQQTRPAAASMALEGPLFVRYAHGTSLTLQRFGPLPELQTLAGETLRPRSFLQVPLSADVEVTDIQIILDNLQGSEDDILDALRDPAQECQFIGRSLTEVCSSLLDTLDRLEAAGSCRVIEALATTLSDGVIRIDRQEGIDPEDQLSEIIAAAGRGDAARVAIELKKGLDPNAAGTSGPLLQYAIAVTGEAGVDARKKVVAELLDHGADIESRDKNGWTALLTACHTREAPMIRLLLDRGADPDAVDNKGWSPLHYLTYGQADPELFSILRDATADPDIRSTADGNTALMIAVDRVDIPRVQALLAIGANPSIARHDGLTALHLVAVKQSPEIVRLLLEAGAPVNQKGGGPDAPPLHQAAACGDVEMVRLLLSHGADSTLLDANGHTAIEIADGNGHFEMARLLDSVNDADTPAGEPVAPVNAAVSGTEKPSTANTSPELNLAADPVVAERLNLVRQQAPTIMQALDDLEGKLTENPGDTGAWKLRGILLQQVGLTKQALACFNKVIELDEDDPDAFVYSGQIMLTSSAGAGNAKDRQGLLDYARGAFATALDKDPTHVEAAIGLGVYYITTGHPEEAHTWLDRALRHDPTSGKACYMKGLALNSTGKAAESAEYMAKAEALGFGGA